MAIWVIPGSLGTISSESAPGPEWVEFTGTLVYDPEGNLDMVALLVPPYLRPKTDEEKLAEAKAKKLGELNVEYMRLIRLINEHIGNGADGLEWAEATLKAARDLAEVSGKQILAWIRDNTALNPPDSIADISGGTFVATITLQGEIDAINSLRVINNGAKAAIDALTDVASVDAYDVAIDPGWPA